MPYKIGEVAAMFGLTVSTLRYYDSEGLFPGLKRISGIRQFEERDLEALRVIQCLKRSGLEIPEIRQFMQWCKEGPHTYSKRRELFECQKEKVKQELEHLTDTLAMLSFKCWYYEQLLTGAKEDELKDPANPDMPAEIRAAFKRAHSTSHFDDKHL